MKIDPQAILRSAQALLTESSQEDRKTGEALESRQFGQYLEARKAEVEFKYEKANADYHVHNVEGAWSLLPVVGSGIGAVLTMGKDGREDYLRRIPGIGDGLADHETEILTAGLFCNAITAGPAALILANDAMVPEASRFKATQAEQAAGEAGVEAETLKKGVEDLKDFGKRGSDDHRQAVEQARSMLSESAQATRSIYDK